MKTIKGGAFLHDGVQLVKREGLCILYQMGFSID